MAVFFLYNCNCFICFSEMKCAVLENCISFVTYLASNEYPRFPREIRKKYFVDTSLIWNYGRKRGTGAGLLPLTKPQLAAELLDLFCLCTDTVI